MKLRSIASKSVLEPWDAGRHNAATEFIIHMNGVDVTLIESGHDRTDEFELWHDVEEQHIYGVSRNDRLQYVGLCVWNLNDETETHILATVDSTFIDSEEDLIEILGKGWSDLTLCNVVRRIMCSEHGLIGG